MNTCKNPVCYRNKEQAAVMVECILDLGRRSVHEMCSEGESGMFASSYRDRRYVL